MIDKIKIRGARVHNLKNVNVDVPLNTITAIAGVSGSGKSSLALGVLYAEAHAAIWSAQHLYAPPHDAGRQSAGGRSFVRACRACTAPASRRAGHTQHLRHGHRTFKQPAPDVFAPGKPPLPQRALCAANACRCRRAAAYLPECGARFWPPGAEELAFNSQGACRTCDGTGLCAMLTLQPSCRMKALLSTKAQLPRGIR